MSGERERRGVIFMWRRRVFSSVPFNPTFDPFQLRETKILQEASLGIKRPIQRANAALLVAGVDPVNQFLIAELVTITLTVVNVATIDLAMPKEARLCRQSVRCQAG